MRLQFEKIEPEADSSFKVVHLTSPQTCWVYWHYHPEYEIVYIPEGNGRRHVGQHVSTYEEGELVFIGPNIPHLNFSYDKVGPYEEVVVQLRDDFMGRDFLQKPEMETVRRLFGRASQGLVFGAETKRIVGPMLTHLPTQTGFDRLLTLLTIFRHLAQASDVVPLQADGIQFTVDPREEQRINRIYTYVSGHYAEAIDLRTVADLANLTVPAFCRYFKRMTQLTFSDFVNEYRVSQARRLLHTDKPIAAISTDVGYTNLSHFNKTFKAITGQTPTTYRKGLAG
ncbi:AraC family transcriptional regulator [Fibrivirga algicola]|uniref:Helix-turn-helix transcriptional regulator n=1 Tax=Fibrivirga algicola TaxID=2950420 RepID=A0ABX0QN54_9BACT|nr:AraC family transcriptional regulator [Fibrivirga algicola]NID12223.1 helix-turn-helix transcriptional regulator [Fibrivirga algicola]